MSRPAEAVQRVIKAYDVRGLVGVDIDEAFVADATRVLSPGGVLRLATDWEHYAHQMRRVADACPALESATPPQSGGEPGWARRFAGRPETTFERKGLRAGRRIYDLEYRRRAG